MVFNGEQLFAILMNELVLAINNNSRHFSDGMVFDNKWENILFVKHSVFCCSLYMLIRVILRT